MPSVQKLVPCLWFDNQAEEAANYYVSIFDGRITKISRYTEAGREIHGRQAGTVMTVAFEILGQSFTGLNGGPLFKFNEAISFQVMCDTQDEIDRYWEKLTAGGDVNAQQCGWLKDKFGVSWQVVPAIMADLVGDPDPVKAGRVMSAFMPMKKLDIGLIKKAYAG